MYTGSTSPPVTGDMSREHLPLASSPNSQPLISPTSLSFSKQPLPRSVSGRQPSYTGSSPFIPSSLERDNSMPPPALPYSQGSKRHPSGLGTSQGQRARVSSYGSSGGDGERTGQNLLRRSSTRMSTESGLRHSLEASDRRATSVPDNDDIQVFLKTLETLPQPPSLAAQASRARMPSASSSLSNTSIPHSPSVLNPNSPLSNTFAGRAPVTRAQVDDAVKRMTGSFVVNTKTLEQSSLIRPESRTQAYSPPSRPTVGLLSASRPATSAARRVSPASLGQGSIETSGISPSSVKRNSPLSGASYLPAPTRSVIQGNPDPQAVKTALPLSPPLPPPPTSTIRSKSTARSLPAGPGLVGDKPGQSAPISGFLSPQPTGPAGSDARSSSNQRRGPVLLRGGFEGRSQSQSKTGQRQSTSPSRSPIRDYSRLGAVSGVGSRGGGESQAEAELIGWRRYRSEQRIQLRARGEGINESEGEGEEEGLARAQAHGPTGVRRQSTGAGNVLGDPGRGDGGGGGGRLGLGQGQQTAPSSLGRYSPESD
jgi:autophagy-related protein 13